MNFGGEMPLCAEDIDFTLLSLLDGFTSAHIDSSWSSLWENCSLDSSLFIGQIFSPTTMSTVMDELQSKLKIKFLNPSDFKFLFSHGNFGLILNVTGQFLHEKALDLHVDVQEHSSKVIFRTKATIVDPSFYSLLESLAHSAGFQFKVSGDEIS